MKVTADQMAEGLARYIDGELVPKAPGLRKWMLGMAGGYAGKMVLDKVNQNRALLESIGIMTPDGTIDMDRLYTQMRAVADNSGPVTEHIPMMGDITFSSDDIDKLYHYITG